MARRTNPMGSDDNPADDPAPIGGDPPAPPVTPAPPATPAPPPMTPGVMTRLFLVPLLIVVGIVGCAVVVVLLFGGIVTEPERSVDQLIAVLERPTGRKMVGMMLPRDKEVWQAAQELAGRLKRPDQELRGSDRTAVARRLAALVQRDGDSSAELSDGERQKLAFVMMALARVGEPESLPVLVDRLASPSAATRQAALIALSYYPGSEELGPFLAVMTERLTDEALEVRIVACAVVAHLAERAPGVRAFAADRLADGLNDPEREVQWNAALGLGRLADRRCKLVLLDLLDRTYWEEKTSYRAPDPVTDSPGGVDHPLPPGRINVYLKTAIEAAACFLTEPVDTEVRKALVRLSDDTDAGVSGVAVKLLSTRPAEPGG